MKGLAAKFDAAVENTVSGNDQIAAFENKPVECREYSMPKMMQIP